MYLYTIIIKYMRNLIAILLVLVTFSLSAQTELEDKMTIEINKLRANPKSFIPHVEKYIMLNEKTIDRIKSGKCKVTSSNGSGVNVINERIYAANELISELNSIESLDTIVFNVDMYLITKNHAKYLDTNNKFTHKDSIGNRSYERFKSLNLDVTENLVSVGFSKDKVTPMLLSLLVDAGIENRGHRKNLLADDIRFISVAIVGKVCVQNFAN